MERVIQVATLVLAGLAAVFGFVAMRVALDARDAAEVAANQHFPDSSSSVHTLQDALIRAGVIEDPSVIPDDHGELGGPWARCLTEEEREAMGEVGQDAPPPDSPCGTIVVEEPECVLEPDPDPADDVEFPVACDIELLVAGRRFLLSGEARPDDVDADTTAWFNVTGTPGIDRYAHGEDEWSYLHFVDYQGLSGWWVVHPADP